MDALERRDATGGLVYKTHINGPSPPKSAPAQQGAWWEWVRTHVTREQEALVEAVGVVIASKCGEVKDQLSSEIVLLKRELTILPEEVAVERKLKALKEEIPRLPALEAQLDAKQAETRKEIARLRKELSVTRDRLTVVHGELSQTRFNLSRLESTPKPVVTVTLSTPQSTFIVRDDDPAAAAAWRGFLENVVESNPDLEGRVNGSN